MPEAGIAPARLRIALGVLVLALAPLLFLGGPDNHSARSFKLAWQLGHPLLFFVLTWLLVLRWPRLAAPGTWRLLALAVTGSVVLGGAIELLQRLVGRESSLSDLRLDVLGAVLAAGCFGVAAGRGQRWARRAVVVAAVGVLLVLDVRPLLVALIDEHNARRAFPVLSDFDTPFEIGRWAANGPMFVVPAPEGAPGHALRVDLQPAKFAGFRLQHFSGDWRGYRALSFRIHVERAEGLSFTCRIHDRAHESNHRFRDRYNQRFALADGWSPVEIPLDQVRLAPADRQMDMARIAGFECFMVGLAEPLTVHIGSLVLR